MDVSREAPILAFSTVEQYSADTVAKVAASEQTLTHQNTTFALRTLASQLDTKKGNQQSSKLSAGPTRGCTHGRGSRGRKPYS